MRILRHDGQPTEPEIMATEIELSEKLKISQRRLREAIIAGRIVPDAITARRLKLFNLNPGRLAGIVRAVEKNHQS